MNQELTASEFLKCQLNLRDDAFTAEERAKTEENRAFVEAVARTIVRSRSDKVDEKLGLLEVLAQKSHDLFAEFLDEYYSREMLEGISRQVERTLQMAKIELFYIPSKVTSVYLQEATRAYILGLPQASVALSRAAMEQALKESIGYQSTNTNVDMSNLLDEAQSAGVLDGATRVLARDVAKSANQVLHENPTNLRDAYDVLIKMRGVVQFLYSSA